MHHNQIIGIAVKIINASNRLSNDIYSKLNKSAHLISLKYLAL